MNTKTIPQKWDWLQTHSGKQFFPFNPQPEAIDIWDIATALAKQCRYNGHCQGFYSVAQHSVLVSYVVPLELALWGLLHDAGEAYVGDMVYGVKRGLPEFKEVEEGVMRVIADKFGLSWPEPPEVKHADLVLLATEKRDLMGNPQWASVKDCEPLPQTIVPWDWETARDEFMIRFDRLGGGHSDATSPVNLVGCGPEHIQPREAAQ